MKSIVINISELGRVRNSKLELRPFVIFSGESGLGKSYMALLCHYFFEILINPKRINRFFDIHDYDYKTMSKGFQNEGEALRVPKSQLEEWLSNDAIDYIGEMLGNTDLTGRLEVQLPSNMPDDFVYTYKEEMTGLVNNEDVDIILGMHNLNYRVKDTALSEESPFAFLMRFELISYIFGDFRNLSNVFVFPPSRGPILTEIITAQTGMYDSMLKDLNDLNRFKDRQTSSSTELVNLFRYILEGETKRKDNKYIYTTEGVEMPISAAAASIREIAPLEMLAKKVDVSTCAILLEEPEAHLHPLKQRMMADILSAFVNAGAYMQITTHSDYLIRRLNELIALKQLGNLIEDQKHFDEICSHIGINKNLALPIDNIAAYILRRNPDGSSHVVRQQLNDGVPYLAFSDAIKESMYIQRQLEEALNEYGK